MVHTSRLVRSSNLTNSYISIPISRGSFFVYFFLVNLYSDRFTIYFDNCSTPFATTTAPLSLAILTSIPVPTI
ncbi:MAG: hypothetical protein ABDH28_04910, partial [Brevinematia bacterium]